MIPPSISVRHHCFTGCLLFTQLWTQRQIAAIAYTLIETAKLSGVDPQAWLTNILGRIANHKINRVDVLPWRYTQQG